MTAASHRQTNSHGSFANPLTVSSNLTVLVNVDIFAADVSTNNINCIDCVWFGTFSTIECEKPTLTTAHAATNPEVAIKLDLQSCIIGFLDKMAVLQE
ncbi:MAG: hypothetical protein MI923_05950 [Phycisphaerales bacterium]|nr:hypothetical protein [Phycisphaerales bacterium]